MVRAGRALQRGIHLQLEAFDLAGSFHAADLIIIRIGGHRGTCRHFVAPHVAVDCAAAADIRIHQALVGQLAHILQELAGLITDRAREIFALLVIPTQRAGAGRRALAKADAPAGHRHTVGNVGRDKVRKRIGIGIIFFVGLQDVVQIVERLGIVKALVLQVILTHDEAAVKKRGVCKGGHVITLAVGQRQRVNLFLHAEFFHIGVEVRRPVGIIADGHDRAVQRQRGVLTLGRLIQDHVRAILLRVQRQRNLRAELGRGNGLYLQLQAADLGRLLCGKPVVLPRKGGVVGIIHAHMDQAVRGERGVVRRLARAAAGSGRRCAGRIVRACNQAHDHHQCQRQSQNGFQ